MTIVGLRGCGNLRGPGDDINIRLGTPKASVPDTIDTTEIVTPGVFGKWPPSSVGDPAGNGVIGAVGPASVVGDLAGWRAHHALE